MPFALPLPPRQRRSRNQAACKFDVIGFSAFAFVNAVKLRLLLVRHELLGFGLDSDGIAFSFAVLGGASG